MAEGQPATGHASLTIINSGQPIARLAIDRSQLTVQHRNGNRNIATPSIDELSITAVHLNNAIALPFARALSLVRRLVVLDLRWCWITDLGAVTISRGLVAAMGARGSALRSLDLSGNIIGPTGAGAVADVLRACGESLHEFSISHNKIGDAGVEAVVDALPGCPNMRVLDMDVNRIGDRGIKSLGRGLLRGGGTLEELRISTSFGRPCRLTPDGVAPFAQWLGRTQRLRVLRMNDYQELNSEAAATLFSGLAENRSLRALELRRNGIVGKTVDRLVDALQRNAALEALYLEGNMIALVGSIKIRRALNGKDRAMRDLRLEYPPVREQRRKKHGSRWLRALGWSGAFLFGIIAFNKHREQCELVNILSDHLYLREQEARRRY
ncbi:unnamed protein product [Pedinophyceae sp. YPF-701]|nr:unnamed protein product [Pedinophyceae sp. YPF-701]